MAGSKKSVVIISYAFLSGAIADGVGTELLSLEPSARESITRQLVSTQKSRQLAQDLSCVRVVTGTETDNDGYLSVSVDSTVVVQQANFALGEVVLNTCYSTCPPTFSVTNSDTNAWTGFIYWAYYGKFESGMTCTNCGSGTGPTYPGYVAVDGDGNSGAQAAVTCLDGATCTIEAPACTLPPTHEPTRQPIPSPSQLPTLEPIHNPTPFPALVPTLEPTLMPTLEPTLVPTILPTTGFGIALDDEAVEAVAAATAAAVGAAVGASVAGRYEAIRRAKIIARV